MSYGWAHTNEEPLGLITPWAHGPGSWEQPLDLVTWTWSREGLHMVCNVIRPTEQGVSNYMWGGGQKCCSFVWAHPYYIYLPDWILPLPAPCVEHLELSSQQQSQFSWSPDRWQALARRRWPNSDTHVVLLLHWSGKGKYWDQYSTMSHQVSIFSLIGRFNVQCLK